MRLLIVGIGRAGLSIATHLSNSGHEVTVVDRDREVTEKAAEQYGLVALFGDATDAGVLEEAEVNTADVVVVMLRRDADNLAVARHDPANLPGIVAGMNLEGVDVVVLSACVQMQSLPAVAKVEAQTGKPVVTAAIATTYAMLKALDLEAVVPGAGALLSGAY